MAKLREILPNYQEYLDRGMSKEEVLNIAKYRLKQANQQNVSQAQSVQSNANSNVAKMHDAMPGTFTQLYPNSSDIDQFFMNPKQIKTEDNSFFRGVQGITKGVLKNVRDYSKLYDDITTSKPTQYLLNLQKNNIPLDVQATLPDDFSQQPYIDANGNPAIDTTPKLKTDPIPSELTKWAQKHIDKIEKAQDRWHNRHPDEWDVAGNIGELTGDFGSDPLNVIPIGAETRAARMIGFGAIGGTSGALDAYGEGGDAKDIAKDAGYGAVGSALFGEGTYLIGKGLYKTAEYIANLIKKHPEVADTLEVKNVDSSLRASENDKNAKESATNAVNNGASEEEVKKVAEDAMDISPHDIQISDILNNGKAIKNKRMLGFNSIKLLENSLKDKPYSSDEFLSILKNEYGFDDEYALKMTDAYVNNDPNIVAKWADEKIKAFNKKHKVYKEFDDIVKDLGDKSEEQKNKVYDEGIPPEADEMKDAVPGEEVPIDIHATEDTTNLAANSSPSSAIAKSSYPSAKATQENSLYANASNEGASSLSDKILPKADENVNPKNSIVHGNGAPALAGGFAGGTDSLVNQRDMDGDGKYTYKDFLYEVLSGAISLSAARKIAPKLFEKGEMRSGAINLERKFINKRDDRIKVNELIKEAEALPRRVSKDEFYKQFGTKGWTTVKTPIGDVRLNVSHSFKHFFRNTYNQNRSHLTGALKSILEDPLFVVKEPKKNNITYYKPFKSDDGAIHLLGITKDNSGKLSYKTTFDADLGKVKGLIKVPDNNILYFKDGSKAHMPSYSAADAVQTIKSQKANASNEGASSLSDKILPKADKNVKYGEVEDWTHTLAKHEGAYDEPVIRHESDTAKQLEVGSPYPTLQHSKLSEHGDGDNALSPTDKNIIPKDSENVKLSEKEVEEFKDAIKDGGVDQKAADTIVKTGIKLHGGFAEPVWETVVKPWSDLHAKMVSAMENAGRKMKKIPLKTVKVPVEKISAKRFKKETGFSVDHFIKYHDDLFDQLGGKYDVINKNGKNFVYRLGDRQVWNEKSWANALKNQFLDQHSDEFVKAIHLHNAAEANILKEAGKLHERIKKEIDPKIGKELIHALDGDLDPSKLRPELRKPYEEFRKIIDEKAKMLMDLGLLDPEDKIEHYVKRLYEEHIQNKGFLDGVRESLIRREKGGRSGMLSTKYKRKDMSLEEREKLGQVFDASTVIPATVMAQDRQIERGVFFRDIARKFGSLVELNGYAQVPNDVRFGKLSGMWVPSQIHYAIVEAPEYTRGFWRYYEKLFSHWKVNKTVKNPFTHLYNAGSNIEMMVLSHTKPNAFIRQWRNGKLKEMVARAEKYGMIDDANLMFNLGEHTKIKDDPNDKRAFFKIINAMRATFNNLYLSKDSYLGKGARTVYNWEDKLFKMIAMEDNIYKMKLEKYEKLHGEKPLLQRPVKEIDEIELTPDEEYEAFKRANELFVDYQRPLPPLIDKINRRIVPFTSFAYKSTPVMLRQMMLHPLTAATINMIGGGIVGRGAALLLGLAGFEKAKEFADSYLSQDIDKLPHYKWMSNGYYDNLFGVDSWRKIGGDKEHTTYFNQGRLLQGMRADFLDALLSGGMIGQILSYGQGRDATTGRAFYHDDDPKSEKIKKTIYKMAKDFLPSTWGNLAGKFYEAFRYGQNLYGEPMTPSDVIAQAAGFRRVDNAKAKVQALKEVNKKINVVKNIDRRRAYAKAKHDKYIRTHGVEGWSDRRTKKFLVDLNDKYERYKGQLIDLNKQKENINSWSDYDPTAHKAYHHRKVFSVIPRGGIIRLR